MVCKNRGIYSFFGPSWVLITMVPRYLVRWYAGGWLKPLGYDGFCEKKYRHCPYLIYNPTQNHQGSEDKIVLFLTRTCQ